MTNAKTTLIRFLWIAILAVLSTPSQASSSRPERTDDPSHAKPSPTDSSQLRTASNNQRGICTQPQNGPGCQGNTQCEVSHCSYDPFCCEVEWDWICAQDAAERFECACPGPELQIIAPDPLFDDYYLFCNYETNEIDFMTCPDGKMFQTDGNHIGRCV